MRQFGLIAGALVLILALAMLNKGIGKNTQSDTGDGNKQTQSQEAVAPPPSAIAGVPPEFAAGNMATAQYKITVGWQYDTANQAKSDALNQAVGAIADFVTSKKNTAAAEIVDIDIPAAQRSPLAQTVTTLGVTVNGKPVPGLTNNPGEAHTTAANIPSALQAVTP